MGRAQTEREYPRKTVRRAYVEYSRAGTRLSRMFRPEVQRGPMLEISRSGVRFRSTEGLDAGEALYMTLRFASAPEAVRVKAEVRWARPEKKVGADNYTHIIGAEFVDFTSHAWDLISAALRE